MVKLVFLNLSMKILSIAVDEQLQFLLENKEYYTSHMVLIGNTIEVCYGCHQDS